MKLLDSKKSVHVSHYSTDCFGHVWPGSAMSLESCTPTFLSLPTELIILTLSCLYKELSQSDLATWSEGGSRIERVAIQRNYKRARNI